jgi:hypothetical protein
VSVGLGVKEIPNVAFDIEGFVFLNHGSFLP